ncbi:MAG: tryptophan synthase subunit alpha [Paludibacteraceae bacterium]|jgi:tryptophan synthase alpha chain|nr:tryptophan synthase subunit alpha [Paludibacteraceae bacterium]MBP8966435.1 tryptophan synthase subunit alpha [Paludibacteraceae bacterium]HOF98642.1 tryptophan synthase subunit alpha [Paludibacteraceae bacterium]HOR39151.1 tryptophan synthase subunit alpha [Paludibacteraceae bacterium]HPL76249.1 tryptophan synthase subunit alpha [Paludibacteraceae bacterium]
MNRIQQLFTQKKENILSVYFTAGFPKPNDTVPILESLQKYGVDMAEIGIPFSDPLADGPVIQNSSQIALKNGMNLKKLFSQLANIRASVHIPLVMMGYLNPIMQFGFENFCSECKKVGVDGMIIPDLPMDVYLSEYREIVEKNGLDFIFLITPETSEERIHQIDEHTHGFIYMVSSAGVTGTQNSFDHHIDYFNRINSMHLKNPRLIGFGISNKLTRETASRYSSGVIIGSAFIKALQESSDVESAVKFLIKKLKE